MSEITKLTETNKLTEEKTELTEKTASTDLNNFIKLISAEIPRIIINSNCQSENNDEIETIIKEMDNGNEPLILKIVSGNATHEEIATWANDNNIAPEDLDETLSVLTSAYMAGGQLAENIANDLTNKMLEQADDLTIIESNINNINNITEINKEEILEQLNNISDKLESLKSDIENLIKCL